MLLATQLRELGVDLIDTSSGGLASHQRITVVPGYQVPFAKRIRADANIATAAVGLITDASQAERIVAEGDADMVFMAREMLRNPHWPLLAAHTLDAAAPWPKQYERAKQREKK